MNAIASKADGVDLSGRCVLVTGGSMGIGFAVAHACLEAGARVGICARTESPLEDAERTLKAQGYPDVVGLQCDVTEEQQVQRTLDELEARFGPVTAIVHAAAILGPIGPLVDVDTPAWWDTVRVNLFGSFVVLRQGARRLVANGGGRMALFAGGGAAGPFPNYSAYACSKAALVRLVETAAAELTPLGVEVNCIAPGFVITRMHDETLSAGERAGSDYLAKTKAQIESGGVSPSVAARAAAILISDAARGITGRFVAAPYDGFEEWPARLDDLAGTDLFTLRRIVPRDRGLDWQ